MGAMADATSVLIVSSDEGVSAALAAFLIGNDGTEVVGQASTAREAATPSLGADVALILPGMGSNGELVTELASRTAVVVLGDPDDADAMVEAVEAGALAFLGHDAPFGEIVEAVHAVSEGRAIVPPQLLGSLLRRVVRRRRSEREAAEQLSVLTDREREIFELTARGLGRIEAAEMLFISPHTVRTHMQRILAKLNLHSRSELVAFAARCGYEVGVNGKDVDDGI